LDKRPPDVDGIGEYTECPVWGKRKMGEWGRIANKVSTKYLTVSGKIAQGLGLVIIARYL
jgi:hypothetical protein